MNDAGLKTFSPGAIMFARVGDIGAGINLYEEATISPNIIVAELNESINPYFVGVFANTQYGRMQLEAGMKVVAQPTISTDAIRELKIPTLSRAFQNTIADIFKNAVKEENQSGWWLQQAESTLIEALGLENWQAPEPLSYVRNSSEAFAAGRLDAEHFQEANIALREVLTRQKQGFRRLGELALSFTNGAEIREYQSEGTPYLRVGDIKNLSVDESSVRYVDPVVAENELQKVSLEVGDVLVSRSGSLAVTAVVEPEWSHALLSSHLIRVRIADPNFDPYYVALFLSTLPGKMQIKQWSNGGVQPEINQPSLAQIVVPKIPRQEQQEIRDAIFAAREKRQRATQLLEAAKRAVEIAIEHSEAEALAYLETITATQGS